MGASLCEKRGAIGGPDQACHARRRLLGKGPGGALPLVDQQQRPVHDERIGHQAACAVAARRRRRHHFDMRRHQVADKGGKTPGALLVQQRHIGEDD